MYVSLVCLRSQNKIAHLGAVNNRALFPVLEAGKFKIKVPTVLVSGECRLPGSEMAVFSLCSHTVNGAKELSGVLL